MAAPFQASQILKTKNKIKIKINFPTKKSVETDTNKKLQQLEQQQPIGKKQKGCPSVTF